MKNEVQRHRRVLPAWRDRQAAIRLRCVNLGQRIGQYLGPPTLTARGRGILTGQRAARRRLSAISVRFSATAERRVLALNAIASASSAFVRARCCLSRRAEWCRGSGSAFASLIQPAIAADPPLSYTTGRYTTSVLMSLEAKLPTSPAPYRPAASWEDLFA